MSSAGSGGRPDRHSAASTQHSGAFLRKTLPHAVPSWVDTGSLFFITICCEPRGANRLCRENIAAGLFESVAFYHDRSRWFARLFLVMPDHVHGLLAFPAAERMSEVLRNWKSFTARQHGIVWQRNYFDHRLRSDESWEEKAHYIRINPVRAGMIREGEHWPHVLER